MKLVFMVLFFFCIIGALSQLTNVACNSWKRKLGKKIRPANLTTGFYFYDNHLTNWRDARDFCANRDMKMASFETEGEMKAVAKGAPFISDYWVGASDLGHQPGQFHWADGRVVDRAWFGKGWPDKFGPGKEMCVKLFPGDAKLFQQLCHVRYHFVICEVGDEYSQCL